MAARSRRRIRRLMARKALTTRRPSVPRSTDRWVWRSQDAKVLTYVWMWRIATPVVAVVFVSFLVNSLGASWPARFGSGTPGTFIAVYEECHKVGRTPGESCGWRGDFWSDDGFVLRHHVVLAGADDVDSAGSRAPALDTGHSYLVFPRRGDSTWLIDVVCLLIVFGVVVLWVRSVWRAVIAWRRDRQAVFEEYGV